MAAIVNSLKKCSVFWGCIFGLSACQIGALLAIHRAEPSSTGNRFPCAEEDLQIRRRPEKFAAGLSQQSLDLVNVWKSCV